jgi:hypothetical protein
MSPKEELIQAIEQSPNEVIEALLMLLKVFQGQSSDKNQVAQPTLPSREIAENSQRLSRKQEILVIETGDASGFDINEFIHEIREERIQHQIESINL